MGKHEHKLIIANYSEYPGPRYTSQGESSGEEFYHGVLNPAFAKAFDSNKKLIVILDGTAGFASSFLDEAFGNLIYDFTKNVVIANIEIISKQEPDWVKMIYDEVFNDWEQRRIDAVVPKKSQPHQEWFRLVNNELVKRVWL